MKINFKYYATFLNRTAGISAVTKLLRVTSDISAVRYTNVSLPQYEYRLYIDLIEFFFHVSIRQVVLNILSCCNIGW